MTRRAKGPSAARIEEARRVAAARLRGEVAWMSPMAVAHGPGPSIRTLPPRERAVSLRGKDGQVNR